MWLLLVWLLRACIELALTLVGIFVVALLFGIGHSMFADIPEWAWILATATIITVKLLNRIPETVWEKEVASSYERYKNKRAVADSDDKKTAISGG